VHAALEPEQRVELHRYPPRIGLDEDGALVLEGEAENIAAKKLALGLAASVPGVTGIIDRVWVVPAQRMGDEQIRDHVRDALLGARHWCGQAVPVRLGFLKQFSGSQSVTCPATTYVNQQGEIVGKQRSTSIR
jgi:hypothetical protein